MSWLKKKLFLLKKITLCKAAPKTSSLRHYKYVTKYLLAKKNRILKFLIFKIKRSYGKSLHSGKTLLWGRHAGCKKLFRKLCFFNQDTLGIILFSIYDPNRTSFISAVFDFFSYQFYYVPCVDQVYPGTIVGCRLNRRLKYNLGFRYMLKNISIGLQVCLLAKKQHGSIARAAGTYCQVLQKIKNFCKLRIPSGSVITISTACFATLGVLSNSLNRNIIIGKAGRNVLRGVKPKVRGVAMNPVDNPHGGRTNGGCCWVTPWGKPFLFKKTSRSKL